MCLLGRIDGKEMYEIRNGKMQVKAICEHYYFQNLFGSKIYVLQNLLFDKKRKKRQLILGTMQETVVFLYIFIYFPIDQTRLISSLICS